MVEIINNVFTAIVETYKNILSNEENTRRYYPAHGSNGFTERNLTFNFCHQYLNCRKRENENDIIIWQEIPIDNPQFLKRNNHFDSLIIDHSIQTIFYIESKRIRNTNKYQSYQKDLLRIQECYSFIPNYEQFQSYKKFAVLLSDIWTFNAKEDNRSILKTQIEKESSNFFQKVYTGENETYHINYYLYQLNKN